MPNASIEIKKSEVSASSAEDISKALEEKRNAKIALITLGTTQAINMTKQILNYSISNIGNFTGDYTKTERIQKMIGLFGELAGVGATFAISGAAGIAAVAGFALNKTLEAVSYFQEQRHQEIENNYLLERSGNSLVNGSRGTED